MRIVTAVDAVAGIRSGDQLYVPQRSWFSRNQGFVIGTLTGVAALVIRLSTH